MQRHRKKDRTERAPPTIQKYLHNSAGSPISSSTPVPATNENLYQSCVGGNTGKTGLVCCRKDDLMFHIASTPARGSYPEDDPDSIEVYKEHQQQKHDEQRSIHGSRTQEQQFANKWCAAKVSQLPQKGGDMTIPLGDAMLLHHQQEHQEQLLSCQSNVLSSGSAEYSYAYCEPMLLQRPSGDNSEEKLHTPVSTLSSSGSSYCVPVYAQRQLQHPPSLPLLQRSFRQPSARNPYQHTYGPTQDSGGSGNNTTTTTLHHHHHHHHHHSNYTLPNATTGSTTTTTTGSLRALFSNIFRKSSSSGTPATVAHSAPFLDKGGSGTLQRNSFGDGSSLLGAERHSFTTCYGTKENIYEDIGSQTGLGALGEESLTLDPSVTGCVGLLASAPPPLPPSGAGSPTVPLTGLSVAAEWRHVQVQHERVIGELNLSVERLIMPSYDDEYSQQKDQAHRYHQYTETEIRDCKQITQKTFCRPSVGFDSDVAGSGGTNASVSIGGLRVGSKRLFPAPTPTSSSSPTPHTLGVGSERHSPTVSYGKSYGDVDSGISSSSTSGTSYSSSILYRSITNYQQQQQHSIGKEANVFGSRQQHPQRMKHGLFNLHIGSAGSPATMFASGNRASCCLGPKDQTVEARPEAFGVQASGSTNAAVTNAPDPPPPPDNSLLTFVCPTSDGSYGPLTRVPHSSVSSHTLTSCCFLSDHNLSEREIAMRPFASTHTDHQQRKSRADQFGSARNGSGNFWARFRKLRLSTGSGAKLFSAIDRKIDTDLHLEDFTGESMWPEPGSRPVCHHQLLHPSLPPHRLTLLPLDAHMQCALPPTGSLNANLPPTPHQRTLLPFVTAVEPEGGSVHGQDHGAGDVNDCSKLPQQRSCSPSTPSSVASSPSSGSSSSSSVSPSSPMSPVSSSSGSPGAKHSGNENP
ncbi:uncharacterized protein LOC128711296 [Anopheles marshallii]|uniref:uncharacterized protein LOC128711296 n=1 Tax=Anopheles marshallii TaxID=1521116 RepID=UPI00237C4871|nr:uncharacterized protein LOC128711296 [Anopheles marshallii]